MNAERDRLGQLAAFVSTPIDVVSGLCAALPTRVRQGRQAMANRIQLAHWIGRIAVQQGQKELAKRVGTRRSAGGSKPGISTGLGDPRGPSGATSTDDVPSDTQILGPKTAVAEIPASDDHLPIAGYDSLAALHVVQRLAGLRPDELDAVHLFEQAHRGRRTILAKIEQLRVG